jgi:hypothetical protein
VAHPASTPVMAIAVAKRAKSRLLGGDDGLDDAGMEDPFENHTV